MGNPESFSLLDRLLSQQHYRLSFWKVAAEGPAERVFAAPASDDQHLHFCWALRNASRALAAAFFAASATLFTTSRASSV